MACASDLLAEGTADRANETGRVSCHGRDIEPPYAIGRCTVSQPLCLCTSLSRVLQDFKR